MIEAGRRALLAHQAQLASEGRGYWKPDGTYVYTDCANVIVDGPIRDLPGGLYMTSCVQKPAKEGA